MSFLDADLIARALSLEDQNAFSELVRRHQSPVRAFLAKMTRGDAHLADDLAQETFLKAWRKLNTFRGDSRFSTWLFGIAYNEFRSAARKRRELALEDLDETPPESVPTRRRRQHASAPGFDGSPETAKFIRTGGDCAACCQNGLSHDKEAARVLGCPLGTVKTNVLRGREKLRRHLTPEYQHHESA